MTMFTRFTRWCAYIIGTPLAFIWSLAVVLVWAASGPFFKWSTTHQLIINTATTIITFWLVFLIQSSQNQDTKALHLKIDELIRAVEEADDDFMRAETQPREFIEELDRKHE